jgi:hypothetical protein
MQEIISPRCRLETDRFYELMVHQRVNADPRYAACEFSVAQRAIALRLGRRDFWGVGEG